jgi:hypothetical protein
MYSCIPKIKQGREAQRKQHRTKQQIITNRGNVQYKIQKKAIVKFDKATAELLVAA